MKVFIFTPLKSGWTFKSSWTTNVFYQVPDHEPSFVDSYFLVELFPHDTYSGRASRI
jgi:hypothetical protein